MEEKENSEKSLELAEPPTTLEVPNNNQDLVETELDNEPPTSNTKKIESVPATSTPTKPKKKNKKKSMQSKLTSNKVKEPIQTEENSGNILKFHVL